MPNTLIKEKISFNPTNRNSLARKRLFNAAVKWVYTLFPAATSLYVCRSGRCSRISPSICSSFSLGCEAFVCSVFSLNVALPFTVRAVSFSPYSALECV